MHIANANDLGKQVRQARIQDGMTQGALAGRCGTTQSWISELENGKPRAELELALRVLRELGLALQISPAASQASGRLPHADFDVADLVDMPRRDDRSRSGNE